MECRVLDVVAVEQHVWDRRLVSLSPVYAFLGHCLLVEELLPSLGHLALFDLQLRQFNCDGRRLRRVESALMSAASLCCRMALGPMWRLCTKSNEEGDFYASAATNPWHVVTMLAGSTRLCGGTRRAGARGISRL